MRCAWPRNSIRRGAHAAAALAARADFSRRHPELFPRRGGRAPRRRTGPGRAAGRFRLGGRALRPAAGRPLRRRPALPCAPAGRAAARPRPAGWMRPSRAWTTAAAATWGLDLPEVVALRRRLLPPGERERYLAADARGLSWLEGNRRLAGALRPRRRLFGYFRERELRALLCALAERSPAAACASTPRGPLSLAMSNAVSRREGGTPMRFALRGCERALPPLERAFWGDKPPAPPAGALFPPRRACPRASAWRCPWRCAWASCSWWRSPSGPERKGKFYENTMNISPPAREY